MPGKITINVRHKIGVFGKLAIGTAWLCRKLDLPVPLRLVCFAVNWNSYVSVNGGRWKWTRLDLGPQEFAR